MHQKTPQNVLKKNPLNVLKTPLKCTKNPPGGFFSTIGGGVLVHFRVGGFLVQKGGGLVQKRGFFFSTHQMAEQLQNVLLQDTPHYVKMM